MVALSLPLGSGNARAQLCTQLGGTNFSENFNSLASSGSNNTSVPSEFKFAESGNSGNLTYAADNGASSTGDTYSYGVTGSSERALGEITSGTVHSTIGACFVNNTNHAISSVVIGYTGEQWRSATAGGTADRLDFGFGANATSLTSGTYIDVDALDFTTPNNGAAVGPLNGNLPANRTVIAPFAITPASPVQPEQTFYIRWDSVLVAGASTNDGLAIDDFTIGAAYMPGLATDYSNNGLLDAADYVVWRNNLNQAVTIPNDITPGTVVNQDYIEWKDRFVFSDGSFATSAAVPEPATLFLMLIALAGGTLCAPRRW